MSSLSRKSYAQLLIDRAEEGSRIVLVCDTNDSSTLRALDEGNLIACSGGQLILDFKGCVSAYRTFRLSHEDFPFPPGLKQLYDLFARTNRYRQILTEGTCRCATSQIADRKVQPSPFLRLAEHDSLRIHEHIVGPNCPKGK